MRRRERQGEQVKKFPGDSGKPSKGADDESLKREEASGEKAIEDQAREQTGQQQVRLRIDERNMKTSYANVFRTNGTAEEVMLDFGVNTMNPRRPGQQPEIVFQVNDRVIYELFLRQAPGDDA